MRTRAIESNQRAEEGNAAASHKPQACAIRALTGNSLGDVLCAGNVLQGRRAALGRAGRSAGSGAARRRCRDGRGRRGAVVAVGRGHACRAGVREGVVVVVVVVRADEPAADMRWQESRRDMGRVRHWAGRTKRTRIDRQACQRSEL